MISVLQTTTTARSNRATKSSSFMTKCLIMLSKSPFFKLNQLTLNYLVCVYSDDFTAQNIGLLEKDNFINLVITPEREHRGTAIEIDRWRSIIRDKQTTAFKDAPETFRHEDRNWNLSLGWEGDNDGKHIVKINGDRID